MHVRSVYITGAKYQFFPMTQIADDFGGFYGRELMGLCRADGEVLLTLSFGGSVVVSRGGWPRGEQQVGA
jgi:hypothetical protein